jgi:hypothetical protein
MAPSTDDQQTQTTTPLVPDTGELIVDTKKPETTDKAN